MSAQEPRITKSELTHPPRWFVVTRYRVKSAVNASTGEPVRYVHAIEKFDVTDQMEAILSSEPRKRRTR